jgi:hypothetical protein
MLHAAERMGPDLGPVDAHLGLLVDEAADGHVVAAYQVQSVLDFLARVLRVGTGEDSLDRR